MQVAGDINSGNLPTQKPEEPKKEDHDGSSFFLIDVNAV